MSEATSDAKASNGRTGTRYAVTAKARQAYLRNPTHDHGWILSTFAKHNDYVCERMSREELAKLGPIREVDQALSDSILHEPVAYCLSDAGRAWLKTNKGRDVKQGQAMVVFEVGYDEDGSLSRTDPGCTAEDLAMMGFFTMQLNDAWPDTIATHNDISDSAHKWVTALLDGGLIRPARQYTVTTKGQTVTDNVVMRAMAKVDARGACSGWIHHQIQNLELSLHLDSLLDDCVSQGLLNVG
jgi:hypothetical protein